MKNEGLGTVCESYKLETGVDLFDIIQTLTIDSSGLEACLLGHIIECLSKYQKTKRIEELKIASYYLQKVIAQKQLLEE